MRAAKILCEILSFPIKAPFYIFTTAIRESSEIFQHRKSSSCIDHTTKEFKTLEGTDGGLHNLLRKYNDALQYLKNHLKDINLDTSFDAFITWDSVTRDENVNHIWPEIVISDTLHAQSLKDLAKKLFNKYTDDRDNKIQASGAILCSENEKPGSNDAILTTSTRQEYQFNLQDTNQRDAFRKLRHTFIMEDLSKALDELDVVKADTYYKNKDAISRANREEFALHTMENAFAPIIACGIYIGGFFLFNSNPIATIAMHTLSAASLCAYLMSSAIDASKSENTNKCRLAIAAGILVPLAMTLGSCYIFGCFSGNMISL